MSWGRFKIRWDFEGVEMNNVVGLWHADEVMPVEVFDAVELGLIAAMGVWEDYLPTQTTLVDVGVQRVTGAPPYEAMTYRPIGANGANTNGGLPPQIAVTVSWETSNLLIRRGHVQMPQPAKEFCTAGGKVHTDALGYIVAGWGALITLVQGADAQLAILRPGVGVGSTIGAIVSGLHTNDVFDSQGSRKFGVGI